MEKKLGIDPSDDSISFLLGLNWNKKEDVLFLNPIKLNINADSKRDILASQYDVFNFNGSLLNRDKIFMHNF